MNTYISNYFTDFKYFGIKADDLDFYFLNFFFLGSTFAWLAKKELTWRPKEILTILIRGAVILLCTVILYLSSGIVEHYANDLANTKRISMFKESKQYAKPSYLPPGVYKENREVGFSEGEGLMEYYDCPGGSISISQSSLGGSVDFLSQTRSQGWLYLENIRVNGFLGTFHQEGREFAQLDWNTANVSYSIHVIRNDLCKFSKEDLIKIAESMRP